MAVSESLRPALLGAVAGAVIVALAGFTVGGWVTKGSAAAMAKTTSDEAVVVALADICVHQFNGQPDAVAKLVELKAQSPYQQSMALETAGFATVPGQDKPLMGVGLACANKLSAAT